MGPTRRCFIMEPTAGAEPPHVWCAFNSAICLHSLPSLCLFPTLSPLFPLSFSLPHFLSLPPFSFSPTIFPLSLNPLPSLHLLTSSISLMLLLLSISVPSSRIEGPYQPGYSPTLMAVWTHLWLCMVLWAVGRQLSWLPQHTG